MRVEFVFRGSLESLRVCLGPSLVASTKPLLKAAHVLQVHVPILVQIENAQTPVRGQDDSGAWGEVRTVQTVSHLLPVRSAAPLVAVHVTGWDEVAGQPGCLGGGRQSDAFLRKEG